MYIFDINIPDKALTNIKLSTCARELEIPHFRGVFMRGTFPQNPYRVECGIVNLNTPTKLVVFGYVTIGRRVTEFTSTHTDR